MLRRCSERLFSTVTVPNKWHLYVGVCVERLPIITTQMSDMETKFLQTLKTMEFENSLKSDHEFRIENDEKQRIALEHKVFVDPDTIINQTAQDYEDACLAEFKAFTPNPRITEFDEKNITTTHNRKLDATLLLLLKQKIGDDLFWLPPQGIRLEGESLKQSADRILKDLCGTEINAKTYGNAPVGVYKYKYPKSMRLDGVCGAKVFYFLAKYQSGDISKNHEHQWLDRKELSTTLPPPIHKCLSDFLIFN